MLNFIKSVLPTPVFNKLKTVYKQKITHYKRDIYSEFGEDFIAAVLLGFKPNGFYVDIGAFQPKELSVTYYFYKKLNWSGVVVEPNPRAAQKFRLQRPRDVFINKGVAQKNSELTYYEFSDPTLNSFSDEVYQNNQSTFSAKKQIQVQPLRSILEANLSDGQKIDLMNVDVEGFDLEVLQSNDWQKFSPQVIVIEDHHFSPEDPLKSDIVKFLKSKGYQLRAYCLISLIFQKSQ